MQGHSLPEHDDAGLLPVSITMSILAVLLAVISLFGHRAHSKTLYNQNLSIAQWVSYESIAAGRTSYDAILDFLPVAPLRGDTAEAGKVKEKYQQNIDHINEAQKRIRTRAEALETEVEHQEHAADRFDLGDGCLEAALVIVSVTMLTKRRLYWGIGLVLACLGILTASTGFFVH